AMTLDATRAVKPARRHWGAILLFAVTIVCLHLLPLAALVLRSLRDPRGGLSFANYVHLARPPEGVRMNGTVFDAMLLSLGIAVIATAIAMVLGLLVSLVISRKPRQPSLRRGIEVFDGIVM